MQDNSALDALEEERSRLLIVDDSELNRALLANIFQQSYEIQEAENGREGLALILSEQDTLSAVLLDVVMPEMNGLQVLHAMKDEGLIGKIPVFLITAESSEAVMQEAYALGVMDVISKPVVPYIVQRRVDSIVELFSARRKLETNGSSPAESSAAPGSAAGENELWHGRSAFYHHRVPQR